MADGSDDDVVFQSIEELISHFECDDFEEVARVLSDDSDADFFADTFEGHVLGCGSLGIGLRFPMRLSELYSLADELEDHWRLSLDIKWLTDSILVVEHLEVEIELDEDYEEQDPTNPRNRRLALDSPVQDIPEYPYRVAFAGKRTFGEWMEKRFLPHYRGLSITVYSKEGALARPGDTLRSLRVER